MPNGRSIAQTLHEEGLQKVDDFLTSTCSARRLTSQELGKITRAAMVSGWEFQIETQTATRRLRVSLDGSFPFSVPYFFLVDRPDYLVWPHIEKDGFLCLLTGTKAARPRFPAEIAGELLSDAYELVVESETGQNVSDFRTGFHTYWDRSIENSDIEIRSLLTLDGQSRFVRIWRGKTVSVIGDSEEQVLAWQRKLHGDKKQFDTTDKALLLWLEEALIPSQYPSTPADVYRLAAKSGRNLELITHFAKSDAESFYFLFAAQTANGPCLAGVKTLRPVNRDIRGYRKDRSANGFRPGKVPVALLSQRLFSSTGKAERIIVERVDSDWIHGRDQDRAHPVLAKSKIVLAGCGSLGAPLAQQLSMAGVGTIRIVDSQDLSWGNVGRHPLGADRVDESKAVALANDLQRSYPHADITGYKLTYEEFAQKHPELLKDADLIICATAEWETENLLNLQKIAGEIASPILYTWTEPYACAGHAIVTASVTPCLQCGMTLQGAIREPLTVWQTGTQTRSEPTCGAVFQPYGPVELQGTITVAASLVLDTLLGKTDHTTHRVWAGSRALLQGAGGDWSETWRSGHPEREAGGMQVDLPWTKDELCPACGGDTTGAPLPSASEIRVSDSFSRPQYSIT
ncbi:MAG: ThiF family adenylyltransferase [Acidobacteriota bacterium]|nr:ThiF family adenylyltransferase [Acidobacteriota bacterium]